MRVALGIPVARTEAADGMVDTVQPMRGRHMIDVKTATAGPWRNAMVRVTFVLDGRETIVTEDRGSQRRPNPVDRVMLLAARNHIRRRLRDLSCFQHGEPPHVVATGPSPDQLEFSVEGCCDALVERATHALEVQPL